MRTRRIPMAATVMLAVVAAIAVAADPAGRLAVDGGSVAGDLVPVPEVEGGARETFLWQSPRFAALLEFRIPAVAGITYAAAAAPPPAGPFVHLRGGDVIAATIESLDADALVVSVAGPAGPQRLRIDRAEVAAITRKAGGGGAFAGPSGLAGWDQSPAGSWREEAGRIMTDRPRASVTRDVAAPPRARYEIRLSRRRPAEFRLAVVAAERAADDGYVLEEVGGAAGGLMLVRRAGERAAIEPVLENAWRGDSLRVVVFVDQEKGRMAALFPDAEGDDAARAVEVALPPVRGARPSGGFRLELGSGDICLERLQVSGWQGDEPTLRDAVQTTIMTQGGPLEGFTVTSFDAATGAYVLSRGGETKQVPAAELVEIRFPDRDGEPPVGGGATLRIVRADGCAVSGGLVKVDEKVVWLRRPGVDVALAVPRDGIVAIQCLRSSARAAEKGGRLGTLVAGDDRIRGWLAAAPDGGLAWRPVGAVAAAAFGGGVEAEVEYVARKPDRGRTVAQIGGIGGIVNRDDEGIYAVALLTEDGAAARDGRLQAGDRILAIAPTERSNFVETKDLDAATVTNLLRGRIGTVVRLRTAAPEGKPREIDLVRGPISVTGVDGGEQALLEQALQAHLQLAGAADVGPDLRAEYPALVILRSGDVAPCAIESMDGKTIELRSPLAAGADRKAVRVPAELVKAVELIPSAASRLLDKTLRDRLLTLPRMQRDQPPQHLLRLVNGDYLRGRLAGLDAQTVTFEVLGVMKKLPRGQVARIIWLHPEVARPDGDAAPAAEPEPEPEGLLVQGVAADGGRVTLVADRVEDNTVRGRSRAFGESAIDLTLIDRLLLGNAVGRDTGELPFASWVLKPAPEPRALRKPDEK